MWRGFEVSVYLESPRLSDRAKIACPFALPILRAAFKFGRGVHFALRRKMRKPPISRVPAILNGLTNRPS